MYANYIYLMFDIFRIIVFQQPMLDNQIDKDIAQDMFELTHWGRAKFATISQTTFPNAFSWMKMHGFRLKSHWNLFKSSN